MDREEAWNRIDAIIEKHEVDDVYVTINNHKDYDALRFARKLLEQKPCEDAISREDALMCPTGEIKETDTIETIIARFIKRLRSLPPVTPQPKTGHWIAQDIHNCHTDFKCSECGYIHSFMHIYGEPTADYTYCPNCGAKMVETQESEE